MNRVFNPSGIKRDTKIMEWRDTNPANLETAAHDVIVTAYAALHCMEASLWQHCHDLDAFDDDNIRPVRKEVEARLKAMGELYQSRFPSFVRTVWIHGNPNDNDGEYPEVSNYDVEDDIRKALGTDGISYDSESGWFVMYCTEGRKAEVADYIARNHPYMEVEFDTNDEDVKPPMLGSWTVAADWLAERDMSATIVLPEPTPKTGEELRDLLDAAETALTKTGMSLEDATALLLGRKNKAV